MSDHSLSVCVVVPFLNRLDLILRCLDSLQSQLEENTSQIVVFDDLPAIESDFKGAIIEILLFQFFGA